MTGFLPADRDAVLRWMADYTPQSRLEHVLRVEDMAIALAQDHGLSVAKAAQASLMHDLAKYFKPSRLLELAIQAGLEIDPVAAASPHLLHADAGALVAREEFGVEDPEILEAIANHTLGQPGMSDLSCVVFLADSLEPGRGDSEALQTLRSISRENLHEAVWKTCDYTIHYLIHKRQLIHPRALMTRNWFLRSATSRSPLEKQPVECSTSYPSK